MEIKFPCSRYHAKQYQKNSCLLATNFYRCEYAWPRISCCGRSCLWSYQFPSERTTLFRNKVKFKKVVNQISYANLMVSYPFTYCLVHVLLYIICLARFSIEDYMFILIKFCFLRCKILSTSTILRDSWKRKSSSHSPSRMILSFGIYFGQFFYAMVESCLSPLNHHACARYASWRLESVLIACSIS